MLGGCEGGVVMTVMRLAGRPPITARGGEQADVDGSTMTPISAQEPIVVDPLVHALICLWRSETSGAPARVRTRIPMLRPLHTLTPLRNPLVSQKPISAS